MNLRVEFAGIDADTDAAVKKEFAREKKINQAILEEEKQENKKRHKE